MLKLLNKFPAYNDRSCSWFKLKDRSARNWKIRSTNVDYGSECVKTEKKINVYNFLQLGMPMPQWDFEEPCAHEICGTLYEIIQKQIIKISWK